MKRLPVLLLALSMASAGCAQLDDLYVENAYSPRTMYAASYSEEEFDSIVIGDGRPAVVQRLGAPIREFNEENITFMVYSDIGHYTRRSEKAYRQRWLALDGERVVHVFRRTITTDHIPTSPVEESVRGADGVYRYRVRDEFRKPSR